MKLPQQMSTCNSQRNLLQSKLVRISHLLPLSNPSNAQEKWCFPRQGKRVASSTKILTVHILSEFVIFFKEKSAICGKIRLKDHLDVLGIICSFVTFACGVGNFRHSGLSNLHLLVRLLENEPTFHMRDLREFHSGGRGCNKASCEGKDRTKAKKNQQAFHGGKNFIREKINTVFGLPC